MTARDDELLALWAAEERTQPEGWDFSSLDGRMTEDPVPWDAPDDFSVERYADALLGLHRAGEPVRATRKRFWLKARKTPV